MLSKANIRQREKRHADKKAVIEHYGSKCSCCGETHLSMLDIHHIENSVSKHHMEVQGGRYYSWIIANGFPEDLQLLCANCYSSKHRNNGVCEHQTKKVK